MGINMLFLSGLARTYVLAEGLQMGRIPEKNLQYRTKDQMVADLTYVLASPLAYGTKHAVIKNISWTWTEFRGKDKGCPYWTPNALVEETSNPLKRNKKFRHEHIVPISVLIEMLVGIEQPTVDVVRDYCERFMIGVVVTRAEDNLLTREYKATMPSEFFDSASDEYQDPWLRYKRCGIEVQKIAN